MQNLRVLEISSPHLLSFLISSLEVRGISHSIIGPALYLSGKESHICSLILCDNYIVFRMGNSLLRDFLASWYDQATGLELQSLAGNSQNLKQSKSGTNSFLKRFLLQVILKLLHLKMYQMGNMRLLYDA